MVFQMVSEPCAYKEKEWGNKALCGLHKSKLGVSKRQLPPSKDGSHIAKGSWVSEDVYAGWLLRLQSSCSPPRRPRKYSLYHSMGHLHVCQNALWIDECWSHFQREMDIAFSEEKDKYVVIYLDDITVFSRTDPDHVQHLRKFFLKCRKFGISLNPKKSHFAMEEGKLLGHIILKEALR